MSGIDKLDSLIFFFLWLRFLRGEKFQEHLRAKFIKRWAVNIWNGPPEEMAELSTITAFKRHFDINR